MRAAPLLVLVFLLTVASGTSKHSSHFGPHATTDGSTFRVMLATPCFGGQVTDAFHLSVIRAYGH